MEKSDIYENYSKTRFKFNRSRAMVWSEIVSYLAPYIPFQGAVLDLGSGYCDFINAVRAKQRIALDKYLNPKEYAQTGVECIFGDFTLLETKVKDNSLDVVFASNFFEHLDDTSMARCIGLIKKKLKAGGVLMAIQPNYRRAYKNYFDDFTHVKVYSDVSLSDYFASKGLRVIRKEPGFLPFSMKSRLPKARFLVRAYLRSPVRPLAKQMLIIGKKPHLKQENANNR